MKKAVIFDMDGVVSDTQKFHAVVESKILAKYGIFMEPEEITAKYAGVSDKNQFEEIFKKNNIKGENIDKIIFQKWNLMKKIAAGNITAIPYAIELIELLNQKGFKLAIVSASTLAFISYIIDQLKINKYFSVIVSAQEVKNGKPSPDIFLLAAKRLKIDPKNCVVIEDGKSGMIGAKRAGMKSVGFVKDLKDKWPADIVVNALRDLSPQVIEKLLLT